jgi:hypothetical protein
MNKKSRNNIKIQTNPIFDQNSQNSQYITYNKPLFINMVNETNNNYKTSTLSTKINTGTVGSLFDWSFKKENNCNISTKEFDLDNNYSKTTQNFLFKKINTSLSSNEEKNNNVYDTLTPSKCSLFLKDDEEQFTPYLGPKKEEKNIKINRNSSYINNNDIINKENMNYSNIFNNSKEIITRSSLNLKNHLNETLSNNFKTINKYQKLSFYQKKRNIRYSTNNIYINKNKFNFIKKQKNTNNIYNRNKIKKVENITTQKAILIQKIFRGYIYRIKLYNKLKNFTCITIFCQTLNNIFLKRKEYIFKGWIYLIQIYKKMKQKFLMKSNRISINILGNKKNNNNILSYKLKKLIEQNDKLKNNLNEQIINNFKLKQETNYFKDIVNQYKNLLIEFTRNKNININNIIMKENNNRISIQSIINFVIEKENIKKNENKKLEICKNINNISIINETKNKFSKELTELQKNKSNNINNKVESSDLNKKLDEVNNKDYKLIIVKKINFIIKKVPKKI